MCARWELPTPSVVDNSQSFLSWGDSWNLWEAAVSTVLSCWGFSLAWVSGLFCYEPAFRIQSKSQQLILEVNIIVHRKCFTVDKLIYKFNNWPTQEGWVNVLLWLVFIPCCPRSIHPHSFVISKLFEGKFFSFFIAILLCCRCLKSQCCFFLPIFWPCSVLLQICIPAAHISLCLCTFWKVFPSLTVSLS